ncbi:MAG: transposase [Caldilineaceae bacterium]|nr:transposase [Caldilineaceae bacterium]
MDPDITLRVHDDDITRGYNVSVAATPDFVREIAAATGATPDSVGVEKLVAAQKKHLGVVPPKMVYDQAAGTAKKIADVAKASDNQTLLVVRLVDYHRTRQRFGPLDFSLGEHGVLTCPNGQTSSKAYRSNSGDGWNYRFFAAQCEGCPLTGRCRGDAVKPSSYRQVFISSYYYQYRTAIDYMKSDEFKADMALRPHIERVIACLVRYNHARTTRKLGLQNADFQVKMAAAAYNLKHWLVLIRQRQKQQQVRSLSP